MNSTVNAGCLSKTSHRTVHDQQTFVVSYIEHLSGDRRLSVLNKFDLEAWGTGLSQRASNLVKDTNGALQFQKSPPSTVPVREAVPGGMKKSSPRGQHINRRY